MIASTTIHFSRDSLKKDVDHPRVQVWLNKPNKLREGKYCIYSGGVWLATLSLEVVAGMGKEFAPKPGGTKAITMTVDDES